MKQKDAPTATGALLLLNCKSCDDIYRVHPDRPRACLCGKSTFRIDRDLVMPTGPSRLIAIGWEDYDGAVPGEDRHWRIVSEANSSWTGA